jgi:hydrogenase nickel incorporation protein HypA/HybF
MHEYSIVQALVDRIEHEARSRGARSVERVVVRIGDLSGVDAELLQTAYLTFRDRTVCEHAPLEIARVEAEWACTGCRRRIRDHSSLRCGCGGAAQLLQGDEIVLESLEMEVA